MAVPLGEAWFTGGGGIFNGPISQFVEDGGFVKLREISLGYTFDQPWVSRVLGFGSMELRVAGRNLRHLDQLHRCRSRDLAAGVGQSACAASITSTTRRAVRTCSPLTLNR